MRSTFWMTAAETERELKSREIKPFNRFSVGEALDKLAANAWMCEQAIAHGYQGLAACYASTTAHLGLMLLEPGKVRLHIDGAISNHEMVIPQRVKLQRLDAIAWSATIDGHEAIVFFPTREFIDNLKAGDSAPNCFGRLDTVKEIRYAGTRDKDGAHFIGYYTPLGDNGQVSQSLTENEVVRGCVCPWNSEQFDAVQDAIRKAV